MAHRISSLKAIHLIGVIALTSGLSLADAPFIEQVEPPVLRRGDTTRVTVRGEHLAHTVGLWLSQPGAPASGLVVEQTSPQEVVLDVTVPADAPLGMHGLRMATRSGLSNVHIILIEELPITLVNEAERPETIWKVDLPCCLTAPCPGTTVHRFRIPVTAGQTVSFEAVGSRFGKNLDPLVTVRDGRGRIVAQGDNDAGLFFDCRFAHTFNAAGPYVVEIRDARFEGNPTWHYVLRIGSFPAANVILPASVNPGTTSPFRLPEFAHEVVTLETPLRRRMSVFHQDVRRTAAETATWVPVRSVPFANNLIESEPNDQPDDVSVSLTVPGTLNGVISTPGDTDCFAFEMTAGQTVNITAETRDIGSAADLELVLLGPDGKELRRIDDASMLVQQRSVAVEGRFIFAAPKEGLYRLIVSELSGAGGPAYAYTIEISETKPSMNLSADVSRLTVPQNSWQPVPINVVRDRLAGAINLKLIGAPPGVSIEPSSIPADVSELVCRLNAAEGTPLGIATLEIVGLWTSEDGSQQAEAVTAVRPLIDRQLIDKDRRVYTLRENQIRLPPSLRSKVALLVTPPAPFSVDLPEQVVVLTKYQTVTFPVQTQRSAAGFTAPIAFHVKGGQIGVEAQERDNVFARIPSATPDQLQVEGTFHNRINTAYQKTRVDLSATASVGQHHVTLHRTFELDVRSAFRPEFETTSITIEPGQTALLRLLAHRTPTWQGEVTLTEFRPSGLPLPETIVIPAGQEVVEFQVPIPADFSPRRVSTRFESRGQVGRYEESLIASNLTIDVKKAK